MQPLDFNQLQSDPKNPRTINKKQLEALTLTLNEFGDLSGIVKNVTTGQLVGGHQRVLSFQQAGGDKNIHITDRFDAPTKAGTVALGRVIINNEPFTYREVAWPLEKQRAANIAANAAGGEWDRDILAENIMALSQLENADELLALTAIDDKELRALMGEVGPSEEKPEPEENRMSFKLTPGQAETVDRALMTIMSQVEFDLNINPDRNGNALYELCRRFNESQNNEV